MSEKKTADEGTRFQLGENGPMVTAEPELAKAMQSKGAMPADTRSSTEMDTVDNDGIARTSRFEQQFANKRGGGRIPGAERLRGDAPSDDDQGDTNTVGTVGAPNGEVVATTRPSAPVADEPKSTRRSR